MDDLINPQEMWLEWGKTLEQGARNPSENENGSPPTMFLTKELKEEYFWELLLRVV